MSISPEYPPNPELVEPYHRSLKRVLDRLSSSLSRDALVQQMTHSLQNSFQVDRVVLYYFYRHWEGRVTFEALSSEEYSIIGCTGPDQCFNGEYAALYLGGRVRAIADIETEPIQDCHRGYLRSMRVRANLVAPIVTNQGLWGLLLAHHCQSVRPWSEADKELIRKAAGAIATAPSIQ
ncbi:MULTISPECIES: GAF domain-containing protein [unclassified Leptolyngbya]|uniref:GAF domain-containing protein n=1 Tax=unclassified Leptolyngbya TaxID=2650499 RepID=UPI001687A661|nr:MULTISPECIES: GAF domain-containing protein [unclassified Leptolyngbya]MBD1911235.1 GAF domain-containing protein [Leptolyngbya sp. FACHB-8]MBD2155482.1 GAF domain-containing protein [Leptolyngbya sp. FACHB-16]